MSSSAFIKPGCVSAYKSPKKDNNKYDWHPYIHPLSISRRTYFRSNSAWRRLSAFGSRVDCMRSRRAATSISYQKQAPSARNQTPGRNKEKNSKKEKEKERRKLKKKKSTPVVAVERRAMWAGQNREREGRLKEREIWCLGDSRWCTLKRAIILRFGGGFCSERPTPRLMQPLTARAAPRA